MTEQLGLLDFWFPADAGDTLPIHKEYWMWRMRGGADDAVIERFSALTERAAAGDLDHWAASPRGRLALIIVVDQFPRSVWRGTRRAYALDPKALGQRLQSTCERSTALAHSNPCWAGR
ncbi:MAG: hypothetical protein ACI9MC_003061 [Kiritimatiellia bacterium]|jgi:uncharacterized protein (DUF924 family)